MLIDLVRHGETVMTGRLIGRTDPPLTDAGRTQFERQTCGLSVDAVVASPRQRARLPAEELAVARGLPLRVDEDWAEIDFGDWEGRMLAELRADFSTAAALTAFYSSPFAPAAPGGEGWRSLEARVGCAIDRLLDDGADSRVLVSTHGGPMRAALAVSCAIPFASLWAFRIDYGTRITLRVGRDGEHCVWGEIIEVVQA
ncbi:MAG: histidine phosphatase family protein [Hyphomicrobium sp.]|jgi:alpha-ribazole phosphatase